MTAPLSPLGETCRAADGIFRPKRRRVSSQQRLLHAQRLESIATLASGIAHDLNNVLAPIMISADLLRGELAAEEAQKCVAILRGSARRGAEIVRQMLTFTGELEGNRTHLSLPVAVDEASRSLRTALPPGIVLETNIRPDIQPIFGDGLQLRQAIMNLGFNAGDAMGESGRLTIRARNTMVSSARMQIHSDAKPGPHALVTVTDTGHGIPVELIDRIFDPFFTTRGQGLGRGLGLSIAHGIVRSHGGFMQVFSKVGRGAEFQIYLPALAPAANPKP